MKLLQPFLDRFVSSASFSAYVRLVRWLAFISPTYNQPSTVGNNTHRRTVVLDDTTGPIVVASALNLVGPLQSGLLLLLMPVAIAVAVYVPKLRGIQNVCAMLAGQALAFMVPVPFEPSGYLMVPTIGLYFGVIAGLGTVLDLSLDLFALSPATEDAVTSIFQQYLALFATTRAYALFATRQQTALLGLLCVAYLLLSPIVFRLPKTAYWRKHFFMCLDGLAVRAGMLRVNDWVAWWGGTTQSEATLVLPLLLVGVTTTTTNNNNNNKQETTTTLTIDKVAECHNMLALMCAQTLVTRLCTHTLSLTVGILVCLVLFASAVELTSSFIVDICAFAVSLLLVTCLERFLDGCGLPETCFTYVCVFVLLECLRDTWSTASVLPANLMLLYELSANSALWS